MKELIVIATTLQQFKKNPNIKMSKKDHFELLKQAKHQYYNEGESELTDAEYDKLEELYIERYGELPPIGAPVKLDKVKLPYAMGSQNKIKTPDALDKWVSQNHAKSYVASDKLDGISFLYANVDGTPNLYTRGDGVYGKNISLFIPYLDLPKIKQGVAVRGELIMSESKFSKLWSSQFANARNMVAGITNRKDIHKALKDVRAIAYEYISDLSIEKQLIKLERLGFDVVPYKVLKSIDFNSLVEYLTERKAKSRYAIDGIVVQRNDNVARVLSGNPDYAFAFKQNSEEDMLIATVTGITWQVSRLGKLKPVVQIEPVRLGGVTITNLTAHNAKYVFDNNIGKDAKIKITRSGDVIPYIVSVEKQARKPSMPDIDYEWSGVDLVTIETHEDETLKSTTYFFSTMGIEGLKGGSINRLFNEGYTDTLSILKIKRRALEDILGRNGTKIYEQLDILRNSEIDISTALTASGMFPGISYIGFSKLVDAIPNIMTASKDEVLDILPTINGWGTKMIDVFVSNFGAFRKFIKKSGLALTVPKKRKAKGNRLKNEVVLFTGFRDKELADKIIEQGGTVANGLTKSVTILLCPPGYSNNKTEKAKSMNIKIFSAEDFKQQYKL